MTDPKKSILQSAEDAQKPGVSADEGLKKAWSNPSVYALFSCCQLSQLYPERRFTFNQVLGWIQGLHLGTVPVNPGYTNMLGSDGKVIFNDPNDQEANEGKIIFDLIGEIKADDFSLLSNEEFQLYLYLAYPSGNRQYFYSDRMVGSSKLRNFQNSDFHDLPDCASAWIVLDPPKYLENTLCVRNLTDTLDKVESYPPKTENETKKIESILHPTFKQVLYVVGTGSLPDEENLDEQLEKMPDLVIFCNVMTGKLSAHIAEACVDYLASKYEMPEEKGSEVKKMLGMVETFKQYYQDRGIKIGETRGIRIGESRGVNEEKARKDAEILGYAKNIAEYMKSSGSSEEYSLNILERMGFSPAEAKKIFEEA